METSPTLIDQISFSLFSLQPFLSDFFSIPHHLISYIFVYLDVIVEPVHLTIFNLQSVTHNLCTKV